MNELISVIVRFTRTDLLGRALQSLADQRTNLGKPAIELVLVDAVASGQQPELPAQRAGIASVRWVTQAQRLDRPSALAAGIEAATGEFCIILDDYDWFDAGHLQKLYFGLRAARDKNDRIVAATTGVRLIDQAGHIHRIWDAPLRRERMLVVNWLPPQAVLFHTKTAQTQCSVDRSLDIFEDWDLWLQLLQQGEFIHLPGVSANYWLNPKGSGVHDQAKQDEYTQRLREKWLGIFRVELSDRIRIDLERADQLQTALSHIDALEQEVIEAKSQLGALLASKSWRITAPLRAMTVRLHQVKRLVQMGRTLLHEARLRARSPRALAGFVWRSIVQLRRLGQMRRAGRLATAVYAGWLERYRAVLQRTDSDFDQQLRVAPDGLPKISVITPVYKPNLAWLDEAIESVRQQTYPHWELCLVDDGSDDPLLIRHLNAWAAKDSRIRVGISEQNGGISAATNRGLQMASGEFIALMDQDDLLAPQALYWVAREITLYPEAKAIYSDEDKIDLQGLRSEPYFKPEFDPILLLQQNFFSHLGVFDKVLVQSIGGLRTAFDGSQDHDLILRISRLVKPEQIRHIPRVLYHWRVHEQSTASDISSKGFAHTAGLSAVQDHLDIARPGFTVALRGSSQFFEIKPAHLNPDALMSKPVTVEIVVPTRDRLDLLKTCVESLKKTRSLAQVSLTIVDNGSSEEETLHYLASLTSRPLVKVIRDDRPFNYSALNNAAIAQSQADYIVLMNNDIEVIDGAWLDAMLGWAQQDDVGAVGAKLLYPSRTVQHGGVVLGLNGVAGHAFAGLPADTQGYFGHAILTRRSTAVTAATLMVSRQKFLQAGGLNESDLTVAFNDVDLCLKLHRLGYENLITPRATLIHHESASRGSDLVGPRREIFLQEIAYMQDQWADLLAADPAYNPNLSLRFGHALADPPRI